MSKEEFNKIFSRHITIYPIRYVCGLPLYPKKPKRKPVNTAECKRA